MERHWYSDQGLELQVRVYRTRGKFNEYPQLLTPTPSSVSGIYLSGDYIIHPAVVGGISSTVSYGVHVETGNAVAVKKMKRHRGNFDRSKPKRHAPMLTKQRPTRRRLLQ